MALIRFQLDLAIPEAVYKAIPQVKIDATKLAIRQLKALAVKINAGQPNEEMTVRASYHVCRHDEGKSCDPEVEI